jgi:putative sterol carrier protein
MERMPQVFRGDLAADVEATIQFKFTGPEPGDWVVTLANGQCTSQEGVAEDPHVTVNSPSDIWLRVNRRELDAASAFVSGQFSVSGDLGVLLKMGDWFPAG